MKKIESKFKSENLVVDEKEKVEEMMDMYSPDMDMDMSTEDDYQMDYMDDEIEDVLDDYDRGFSDGYSEGYDDAISDMDELEDEGIDEDFYESRKKESMIKSKMKLQEEKSEEEEARDAIEGIVRKDWGGSDKDQYGTAQLIMGLSGNSSDVANSFMDDLNKLTDKMDLSKYGIK